MLYPINLGVPGRYISSIELILKPVSSKILFVSRVKWHPPAIIFQKGSNLFWNFITFTSGALTCSIIKNIPSFFKTRLISNNANSGFSIEHKVYVHTTVSIDLSSNGISSANEVRNSTSIFDFIIFLIYFAFPMRVQEQIFFWYYLYYKKLS